MSTSSFLFLALCHESLRSRYHTAWETHIWGGDFRNLLVRQLWVLRHVLLLVAQGQVKSQAPIMWLTSVKVGWLKECNRKIRNACTLFLVEVGTEMEFNPIQVPVMLERSSNIIWKPRHLVLPFVSSHESSPYSTHLWDESGFLAGCCLYVDHWLVTFPEESKMFMA